MIHNKKAFQLSINMVVVLILGVTLLGVGISIFYQAYNQTIDVKEKVDSQTQQQLYELLDTGEALVIPINRKDGERGKYVDFNLGISNELGDAKDFYLFVRYAGFIARNSVSLNLNNNSIDQTSCRATGNNAKDSSSCADDWLLIHQGIGSDIGFENMKFNLVNNERKTIPLRFVLPKKVSLSDNTESGLPSGQYVFNVDVLYEVNAGSNPDYTIDRKSYNQYFSKKKLYINVK